MQIVSVQGDAKAWLLPELLPVEVPDAVQCPVCHRTYKHKYNLNRHLKNECGKDELITCSNCSGSFTCKRDLYDHITSGCNALRHSCTICKKMFTHRTSLVKHQKECGMEPQFECPVPECGFRGHTKYSLSRHAKRAHNAPPASKSKSSCGVRTFKCPNCKRVYKHERTLMQHLKHECGQDWQHKCPKCGKMYKHNSALWNHINFECGKEPQFKCPLCPYRGKRKSRLQDHMKTHGDGQEDCVEPGTVNEDVGYMVEVTMGEDA